MHADERPLPDEMQQRPADRLGSGSPQAVAQSRSSRISLPSRLLSISFRISPSSSWRRAPRGQRLHHELGRGAAKRAIEQVADELALRLLLGQPRLIDVGAIAVVAPTSPFSVMICSIFSAVV